MSGCAVLYVDDACVDDAASLAGFGLLADAADVWHDAAANDAGIEMLNWWSMGLPLSARSGSAIGIAGDPLTLMAVRG